MVKKSFLVLFLFVLILIPLISSKVSVVKSNDYGISISYPNPEFITDGVNLSVRFWAFNTTDGKILTNTTTNCTYNLINKQGYNIFRTAKLNFGVAGNPNACQNCFNIDVLKGNFTSTGYYSYQIRCQAATIGGYTNGNYIVTGTGLELTSGRSIIYFSILIFFLFFFVLLVVGGLKLPSGNDRDDNGQLISINNLKYLRGVLFFFAYLMVIAMFFLGANLCSEYLGEALFFKFLFTIFQILMGLLLPIIVVWFVWIFVQIIQDKKMRRLLEHGIYEGKGGNW